MGFNASIIFLESIKSLVYKMISLLPHILGAIFVLVTGLILGKILRKFIIKLVDKSNFDTFCLQAGINDSLEKVSITSNPKYLLANLFYWPAILIVIMVSLEILGLYESTRLISTFLLYLPNLLVGFLIIIAGMYGANLSNKILRKKNQTKKYVLVDKFGIPIIQGMIIFVSLSMALYQVGIARGLLASIYVALIGSTALAIFLSFGLASIEIAKVGLAGRILLKPTLQGRPSDLTPKQHEILVFLKDFAEQNNRSPLIREIQEALGDKSTKSVAFKLNALQQKGYIKREKGKHRGIRILK